jgi:hypothetical protein
VDAVLVLATAPIRGAVELDSAPALLGRIARGAERARGRRLFEDTTRDHG